MSKILFISLLSFLIFGAIPRVEAAGTNLIANSSAESISNGQPSSWQKGQWGKLTAQFSLKNPGQDGTASLYLTVTNRKSGDAKWYFSHIPVKPATTYAFSDYYKSNVTSDVTAEVRTTAGTYTYLWLGAPAASSTSFKKFSASFKTPANAQSITVFHDLPRNGWLQTDNYSLSESGASPPPPSPTLVVALSASPSSGVAPVNNVDLAADVSGTASGNIRYRFDCTNDGVYERDVTTTTDPYTATDLCDYAIAGSYTARVLIDRGGITASATQTVTVSTPSSGGTTFRRPLLSIEFDDGWRDAYEAGLPIVNQLGIKVTDYIITETTEWPDYMDTGQIRAMKAAGHDIGSHTVSHPHLPNLSLSQITAELANSNNFLENLLGSPVTLFATPYCESNQTVVTVAKQYYTSLRNCEEMPNTRANFDPWSLKAFIVLRTTTMSELQSLIDQARAENGWLVLVYHRVQENGDLWSISANNLRTQLEAFKASGVTILKTADALAEIRSQL